MWLLLAACSDPPRPTCTPDSSHLLLVTTDYDAGALAAVELDGSCVADPIASSGTDPLVRWLGDRVAVIVDGGATAGAVPSTIVDVTGDRPRLLRLGMITVAQLDEAMAESGVTVETDGTGDDTVEDAG